MASAIPGKRGAPARGPGYLFIGGSGRSTGAAPPRGSILLLRAMIAVTGAVGFTPSASVGVFPMLVEVHAEPGGPEEWFDLQLVNTSEWVRSVDLSAQGFLITEDETLQLESDLASAEGEPGADEKLARYSGAAYIRVPSVPVELLAGEERAVACGVRLPGSQTSGHFAFVAGDAGPARPGQLAGAPHQFSVTLQVGVVVFIIPARGTSATQRTGRGWQPVEPPRYDASLTSVEAIAADRAEARQTLRVRALLSSRGNRHVFRQVSAEVRRVGGGPGPSRP